MLFSGVTGKHDIVYLFVLTVLDSIDFQVLEVAHEVGLCFGGGLRLELIS